MVIRHRMGLTGQIAPRSLIAVLVALVLTAVGCTSGGLGRGDAATVADGSTAHVAVDGENWETFNAGRQVPDGALVRAADDEAVLEFRQGAVRLSPGSTAVVRNDRIELVEGDVLVSGKRTIDVEVGDTAVTGDGLFRVSSGLSSRAAVYSGTATVARPAQLRGLPALRQLDLSPLRLAAIGDPLQYHDGDAWDREFLGDAITFDGEAARLARGIDIEVGRAPLRPRFYAAFAGREVVRFLDVAATVQRAGGFGPPSDVLLTVFVSQAAGGPLGAAVDRVTALREAGARWGLIAVELDVASQHVVSAIDELGNRRLTTAARDAAVVGVRRVADAREDGGAGNASVERVEAGTGGTPVAASPSTTRSGGGDASAPPPSGGGSDGGGSDGGGSDGGAGPGDEDDGGTVDNLVEDVVKRLKDPLGNDDDGDQEPVTGVEVPPLP
ncbi:MAG: hypothetical protein GEU74_11735 [Nitriliruptorales bacterium]|nr:hypothetical protein [Nitriliruptorales bacterium]